MSKSAVTAVPRADDKQGVEGLRRRLEALQRDAAFDHPVSRFELLETHISLVLLTGPFAYKFKKPVRLPFLDFSTLERRRRCCVEELRLNRRTAPELYVDVVRLTAAPQGPVIDGDGPLLDYAVKMVQFPEAARADLALTRGELARDQVETFAELIGRFHERAAVAQPGTTHGSAAVVCDDALANVRELRELEAKYTLPAEAGQHLDSLERWTARATTQLGAEFDRRKSRGYVRECHGDLHLANIVLLDGVLTPFDCIEFNERLRWIDTMSDLAFTMMDFEAHSRLDLARRLLNGYLQRTGDFDGLTVTRYYEVYRALVRAKVAALGMVTSRENNAARERLDRHLAVADRIASAPQVPRVLILHGPSGAGKSWLAHQLIAHGDFIEVRSDVERQRLFGTLRAATETPDRPTPYTAEATERTYASLAAAARTIVQTGHVALVDATFLDRALRERFRFLADELGVPFGIIDVVAPRAVLEARVARRAQRRDDVSEADVDVLRQQLATRTPLAPEEMPLTNVVDTAEIVDAAALAAKLLGPKLLGPKLFGPKLFGQ